MSEGREGCKQIGDDAYVAPLLPYMGEMVVSIGSICQFKYVFRICRRPGPRF